MKICTSIDVIPSGNSVRTAVIAGLISSLITGSAVFADEKFDHKASCDAGFADTWIIGKSCDLGGHTNIKVYDAINIDCDASSGKWSVEFFEEPIGVGLDNMTSSNAVRYQLCPANGYLDFNTKGELVLRCNFWEPVDNVTKQLEFEMSSQNGIGVGMREILWKATEIDNPNVICGISGRPEGGTRDTGNANSA